MKIGPRCYFHKVALFAVGILLQSCANQSVKVVQSELTPQIPLVYLAEFGQKPVLLTESDIFRLLPEQQLELEKYLNHPANNKQMRHERVANYLKRMIKGFNYHSDTLIAADAAATQQGNCLSLAILTTALARVANIDVEYELMQTPPIYQKKGNTILTSQHVRSLLFQPKLREEESFLFTFRPVIKIDYFPTGDSMVKKRVFENEFISMYFRNKAAEAIINDQMTDAFWLLEEALRYAENNSHAINMLALVYNRLGKAEIAEKMFVFGIEQSEEKLELLSNYQKMLLRQQRFAEASAIQVKIDEIDEPNPFDWLELADEKLAAGQLNEALRYYDKVIELAPYLHFGYSGRGKIEFLKGNTNRAEKSFSKAEELALGEETKTMYQAKLSALSSYSSQ